MKTGTNAQTAPCAADCNETTKGKKKALACKLTTPELRERKAKVIASLRQQITGKKELKKGYAYQFNSSDSIIDELAEFIKTERLCCDFFTFKIFVSGDKSATWLEITGPKGAKDFIRTELEL